MISEAAEGVMVNLQPDCPAPDGTDPKSSSTAAAVAVTAVGPFEQAVAEFAE